VLVHVLVGAVRQQHDLADRAGVVTPSNSAAMHRPPRRTRHTARVGQRPASAAAAALDEWRAAAGDVDELADDVGVHARGEILEREVDVVDAIAELGGEVIAQRLRRQALEVAARGDEGAARLRHLLAVHRQEAMHEHGGGRR
jgi:hypothetical protein